MLPRIPLKQFHFAWTQWNQGWLGRAGASKETWFPSPALPYRGQGGVDVPTTLPHAWLLGKKGRGHVYICVGLTDRHALSVPSRQTPATQPCQDTSSRNPLSVCESVTPASETAVTAKQDFWGSEFQIYIDLSWSPLTPFASAQPSVKGWMVIKFPCENRCPSKSWSVFGNLGR